MREPESYDEGLAMELEFTDDDGGKKAAKQIEFKGERLDMTSVRRWREVALARL